MSRKQTKFPSVPLKHIAIEASENYRDTYDEEDIEGLKNSFKSWHEDTDGARWMLEPAVLTRLSPSKYLIIAGFQRIEASRQLVEEGHDWAAQVHAVVLSRAEYKKLGTGGALRMALTENIRRTDASPLDTARALQRVLDEDADMTQRELAKQIGKSPAWVSQRLVILNGTTEGVQKALERGDITFSHARAASAIQDNPLQDAVLDAYIDAKSSAGPAPVYADFKALTEKAANHPSIDPGQTLHEIMSERLGGGARISEPVTADELNPEFAAADEPVPSPSASEPVPSPSASESEPDVTPLKEIAANSSEAAAVEHALAPAEATKAAGPAGRFSKEDLMDALEEAVALMLVLNRAYNPKDVPDYPLREIDIKKAFALGAHALLAQINDPSVEYIDIDAAWDDAMSVQGNKTYGIAHMRKLKKSKAVKKKT